MERERELQKLMNVLHRTARAAQQSEWTGSGGDAAAHSVAQYNRVLDRLSTLEPSVRDLFEPLPSDSSLAVMAMACRQLAAYFEDEIRDASCWGGVYGAALDSESFKDFWRKSAGEIEDLGEFIRESVEAWARRRRPRPDREGGGESEAGA